MVLTHHDELKNAHSLHLNRAPMSQGVLKPLLGRAWLCEVQVKHTTCDRLSMVSIDVLAALELVGTGRLCEGDSQ